MDRELQQKLMAEAPGILRWAINGLLDAKANGIIEPKRVVRETVLYLNKYDVKNKFVKECIKKDAGAKTPLSDIFKKWVTFANVNEVDKVRTSSILSTWLQKMTGATTERGDVVGPGKNDISRNVTLLVGIRIRNIGEDDDIDEEGGN